jgi:hypothetical protein
MDARVAWRRTCLTGLACVCLVWVSGCAVGRDESTGAIILGFEAGRLVETGPQALAAAAGALIPGAGPIIGTIAGVLGIGGAVHYRSRRNGERAGWDERGREVVDSPAGPISYTRPDPKEMARTDPAPAPRNVAGVDSGVVDTQAKT